MKNTKNEIFVVDQNSDADSTINLEKEYESPNEVDVAEEKTFDYTDLTNRFVVEPKEFYEYDLLKEQACKCFENLGRVLLDNLLIIGLNGCGRTTIVEYMASIIAQNKCPKKFQDVSIIKIPVSNFSMESTIDDIYYSLVLILNEVSKSNPKKVILFFDDIENFPKEFLKNFYMLTENLKSNFDFLFFKCIMITNYDFIENQSIYCSDILNFSVQYVISQREPNFDDIPRILDFKIKELGKIHGNVTISPELLDYLIILFYSKNYGSEFSLTNLIHCIDITFARCELDNRIEVEQKDIKKSFDLDFKKTTESFEDVVKIAYHEAGHCLLGIYGFEDDFELEFVKCIYDSVKSFGGLTYGVFKTSSMEQNKKNIKKMIAFFLAGRVAEKFIGVKKNYGSISDLEKAMDTARDYIYRFGINKNMGKNCSYDIDNESELLSAKKVKEAEDECIKLIDKANKYAKKVLRENWEFVDKLAAIMVEEGIVSGKNVYKMWEDYQSSKNK